MGIIFYYTGLGFWAISTIWVAVYFMSEVINSIYKRGHFSKEFLTFYAKRVKPQPEGTKV